MWFPEEAKRFPISNYDLFQSVCRGERGKFITNKNVVCVCVCVHTCSICSPSVCVCVYNTCVCLCGAKTRFFVIKIHNGKWFIFGAPKHLNEVIVIAVRIVVFCPPEGGKGCATGGTRLRKAETIKSGNLRGSVHPRCGGGVMCLVPHIEKACVVALCVGTVPTPQLPIYTHKRTYSHYETPVR